MFPSDNLVNAPSILDLVKLSEDYYMNHHLMNNDDDDDDGMPSKISSTIEPSTSNEWLSLMEGKVGPFDVIDETIPDVLAAARKTTTTAATTTITDPDTTTSHLFPVTAKVPQEKTNKPNHPDTVLSKTYRLGPNDVLAGRGSEAWNHQGNKTFRFLVSENVSRYEAAPTIKAKTDVVASIVKYMKEELGTKFVKSSKDGSYYKLLNKKETHCKVGHALRDLAKIKARNDTLPPSVATMPSMKQQSSAMEHPPLHQHHPQPHQEHQLEQEQKQERKRGRIKRISERLLDDESMNRLIQSLKDPPSSSSSAVDDPKTASSTSKDKTTKKKSHEDTHHTSTMDDDHDDDLEPLLL